MRELLLKTSHNLTSQLATKRQIKETEQLARHGNPAGSIWNWRHYYWCRQRDYSHMAYFVTVDGVTWLVPRISTCCMLGQWFAIASISLSLTLLESVMWHTVTVILYCIEWYVYLMAVRKIFWRFLQFWKRVIKHPVSACNELLWKEQQTDICLQKRPQIKLQ